jgi:hypothetical protein
MAWGLLLASFSFVLTACGNSQSIEPLVDVPPAEAVATEVPATEGSDMEADATSVVASEEPVTEESATETSATGASESPLRAPESPLPVSAFESPLIIEGSPQPGFGGLGGRVFNTDLSGVRGPYANVPIRLAAVYLEPQTNEKLFILSGSESPGAIGDDDGYFLFDALNPGEYVMIVGDIIGYHEIIAGPDQQAVIYVIEEDKVLNAGVIDVELP